MARILIVDDEESVPGHMNAVRVFHEDAKPGDLSLQFPFRWRSSSNQLVTR